MPAHIRPDGGVVLVQGSGETRWESLEALGHAYWTERHGDGSPDGASPAWACVALLLQAGGPESGALLQAVVDAAPDTSLVAVGAGFIEQLVVHSRHGAEFVDELVVRAERDARFHATFPGVLLDKDVPEQVRRRLAALGAYDAG